MKKYLIVCALSAFAIGLASVSYAFDGPPPGPFGGPMAKVLDLTADQQAKIQAILQSERESNAYLLQQESDLKKQLHQAELATTLDEAVVRTIATSLSPIEVELTVSRAKTHVQINLVLTAAQLILAQKLQPDHGAPPFSP
jgi:Spy/CpxP family protein refolding chaperone